VRRPGRHALPAMWWRPVYVRDSVAEVFGSAPTIGRRVCRLIPRARQRDATNGSRIPRSSAPRRDDQECATRW
jgi:hypothetical protein